MRKAATVLLVGGLTLASAMTTHAFQENFVFHYSFDKAAGDTVEDIGDKGNDGTLMNGAKRVANGKFNDAVEFDGGQAHIETVIDVPEFDFTMALWVQTDNPAVGVMSVLDGAAGAGGHDRHFYLQAGNICFRVWQGAGWCTTTQVSDGDWHHIALVAMTDGGQTAYVDGQEVGTFAYDHSDFDWQKRLWIGFSNDAASQYFEGLIDDVAYLDVPLTADDVAKLMAPLAVDPGGKAAATWAAIKTDY